MKWRVVGIIGMGLGLACARGNDGEPSPLPSAAPDAAPQATLDAAPPVVTLTPVPQKPLVGLPDAFEPSGALVGKRSKDHCDVWDVASGAYRGELGRSVCDDWVAAVGHAAGRHVRIEGASVVVEKDGGGAIARLTAACWSKPIAATLSSDGERVAALCGARVWVWPATGGVATDLGEIPDADANVALAFLGRAFVGVLVEHPDRGGDGCDGKTQFVDCDRFRFFHVAVDRKTDIAEEDVGIARLDPFGHMLFRAGGFCGEGDCFEDVRVDGFELEEVGLSWSVTAEPKSAPLPIERRFSEDGSACLVRGRRMTPNGALPAATYALVSKDGGSPAIVAGVKPTIAPDGRHAASIVLPSFDGDLASLALVALSSDGEPPRRRTIPLSDAAVRRLAFNADGTVVAVELPKRLVVYDTESGKPLLFWDGATNVAFDHARPKVVYAQKGDRVVARGFGGAEAPALAVAGKLLRGSFAGKKPLFLSQDGTTIAYDGGGTEFGRWATSADEVVFGEGGLAALVSAKRVDVIALGRSAAIAWSADAAGRVRFVGRELWIDGTRRDATTGELLGAVTLERGSEPSPDGAWSCGDSIVRHDGARLDVIDGAAVSESGAYQGARRGADAIVLRAEGDPLTARIVRAGQLPERVDLVRDFFLGSAIPSPTLATPLPRLLRFSFHFSSEGPMRTELTFVADGVTRLYDNRGALVATVEPGPPGTIHHFAWPGFQSFQAETCIADVCTEKRSPKVESEIERRAFLR